MVKKSKKNRKAIAISYVMDQNAPSVPHPVLIDIPANTDAKDVFLQYFKEDQCEEDFTDDDIVFTSPSNWGDADIGVQDGEYLIFFTVVID